MTLKENSFFIVLKQVSRFELFSILIKIRLWGILNSLGPFCFDLIPHEDLKQLGLRAFRIHFRVFLLVANLSFGKLRMPG
jgi:hypothetical protein